MNNIHIAVISDTHGGSKVGLCNPEVELHDEQPDGTLIPLMLSLNARQQDLWAQDEFTRERMLEQAGRNGIKGLIHLGEQTQGNRIAADLMSEVVSDQIDIACENLKPWLRMPGMKWVRIIPGTSWHEFGDSAAAKLIASKLQDEFKKINIQTYRHGLIRIEGHKPIEIMHHGPGNSKRHWLEGNLARYYLRDRMDREIKAGREVPALYLSGHVHTPVREQLSIRAGTTWHDSAIVIMPPMCYMNDYAIKVSESSYEYITGEMIVRLADGLPPALMPTWQVTDVRTEDTWT